MVVELDGGIDPLSVTTHSVSVTRGDGRPLEAHLSTSGSRVVVELEVGPALVADRPEFIRVSLAGFPSVHALMTKDGRRLARSSVLVHPVRRDLDPLGPTAVRLVRIDGQALPPRMPLAVNKVLRLLFDGVLDPATLRPDCCSVWIRQAGLVLETPIYPDVSWRCRGSRFELQLDLGDAKGPLQLDMRRLGILDLSGVRPEPPLVVELVAS